VHVLEYGIVGRAETKQQAASRIELMRVDALYDLQVLAIVDRFDLTVRRGARRYLTDVR
jgi:hypothetical protein